MSEIENGRFEFKRSLEDIHMNIEARLGELIGTAASRLHTARSRNDQVATDLRLWVRGCHRPAGGQGWPIAAGAGRQGIEHAATIMPGFTHLQAAQPVTFGHHLLAYVEMSGRDRGRMSDARRAMDELPLGAAALAGTGFPIDRMMTAKALGFGGRCEFARRRRRSRLRARIPGSRRDLCRAFVAFRRGGRRAV